MNQSKLSNRLVAVTGGSGLIGSYLCDELLNVGARVIVIEEFSRGLQDKIFHHLNVSEIRKGDLENAAFTEEALADAEFVFHLASRAYGIGYGEGRHIEIFQHNERITNNLLDAVNRSRPKQLLITSSSCVYDDDGPDEMSEMNSILGAPEAANRGYGWAKRVLEQKSQLYARETGVHVTIVRPFNVYGERYNWAGEYSQAIPMLVKKVMDDDDPVVIWGSGNQRRDYVHAQDCARAMLGLIEVGHTHGPVNIASNETISMRKLVELICRVGERKPKIAFDLSKPEGRFIKSADVKKLHSVLSNFSRTVELEEGIRRMIGWYESRFLK